MKSEERHELQTDELTKVAHKVSDALHSSWFDKHGNTILMCISIAALSLAAWIYWSRRTAAYETEAWMEYAQGQQSAASLNSIGSAGSDYASTNAAQWALLRSAEIHLSEGVSASFSDREKSATELKSASESIEQLLSRSISPEVRERAMFVQARIDESKSTGDVTSSVAAYEAFKKAYPNSVLAPEADRRIAALQSPAGKEFYAWFAKQKPVAPALPGPKDAAAGKSLDDEGPALKMDLPPEPLPELDKAVPEKTIPGETVPEKTVPEKPVPETTEPPKKEGTPDEKPKSDAPADPAKDGPKPEAEKKPDAKPETPPATPEGDKKPDAPADKPDAAAEKPADAPAETPAEKTPESPK